MYQLIAAPFLDDFVVLKPGSEDGLILPAPHFAELSRIAADGGPPPQWLQDASTQFGIQLRPGPLTESVLVRKPAGHGWGRASWELNLGCNYDCEHCYLDVKKFEGLAWPQRKRLLDLLEEAGVVWLQMTGGEALVDKLFFPTYQNAYERGMMITLSTNGWRLHQPKVIDFLRAMPPYHLTISAYGATADSYDALVRRKGAFDKFHAGMTNAVEAGFTIRLNLVVTTTNEHEVDAMIAMAEGFGVQYHVFSNMSPTVGGSPRSLPAQSMQHLTSRSPFTGCNAGTTFFHVDPWGMVSVCKVERDKLIPLLDEGLAGLVRLRGIADAALGRSGGCTGCAVQGTCGTCMPLVRKFRAAKSPLDRYCQHRETGEVIINVDRRPGEGEQGPGSGPDRIEATTA